MHGFVVYCQHIHDIWSRIIHDIYMGFLMVTLYLSSSDLTSKSQGILKRYWGQTVIVKGSWSIACIYSLYYGFLMVSLDLIWLTLNGQNQGHGIPTLMDANIVFVLIEAHTLIKVPFSLFPYLYCWRHGWRKNFKAK